MTWAPITPSGFMSVPVPSKVRMIVPKRFGVHLFAPLSNAGGASGLLTLSLELTPTIHIHASTVVSQDELGKDAPVLYERFVVQATAALDGRAKRRAA